MLGKTMIAAPPNPAGIAILTAALLTAAPAAVAVPSFARQTGMACEACHSVFPELTHFGRVFKANGYTLTNLKQVRDVNRRRNSSSNWRRRHRCRSWCRFRTPKCRSPFPTSRQRARARDSGRPSPA
jgi:hypothetical protein